LRFLRDRPEFGTENLNALLRLEGNAGGAGSRRE